jgi:hypothetical protein
LEVVAVDSEAVTIRLERSELLLLNNALNEVSNGVDIPDWEFASRLGQSRLSAQNLLREIGQVLDRGL